MTAKLTDSRIQEFQLPLAKRWAIYRQRVKAANDDLKAAKDSYRANVQNLKAQKEKLVKEQGFTQSHAKAYVKPGIYGAKVALTQAKEGVANDKKEARKLIPPFHWFYQVVKFDGQYLLRPQGHALLSTIIVILIGIACQFFIDLPSFNFNGDQLGYILSQLFGPQEGASVIHTWDEWWGYMGNTAIPLLWETFLMMFIATAVGAILSIPFMIVCASNIVKNKGVIYGFRTLLNVIRTIPTIVFAIMGVAFFGYSMLAGIFAMVFFTMGIMIKIMYEYIETVDMHPYEACISAGATKPKAFVLAIFPQITPAYLSNVLYTFEINIRASVILGFVNAGGIGKEISDSITQYRYNQIGAILIPLFILVFILQLISNEVKKRTL